MIYSMTAFARVAESTEYGTVQWEIRSVNQRFLDINFRLHESMRHLEVPLRERLRSRLQRGKLEVALYFHPEQAEQQNFKVNHALVKGLLSASDEIAHLLSSDQRLSPMQLMQWPGVLSPEETDKDERDHLLLQHFDKALDEHIEARGREGKAMGDLLIERIEGIAERVTLVREQLPEILNWQRKRLLDRFDELDAQIEQDRLEQELVFVAQKTDVAEELDRLDTHVEEIHRLLKKGGTLGRRLDFLIQELNREANTLASKSISQTTTNAAVDMKVLIEQMREQVQNIE